MEKIEVGEYGRTNLGKIFIFAWLSYSNGEKDKSKVLLGNGKNFNYSNFYYFDKGEEIVKHSKNIIDLIEVGDIIEIQTGLYNKYKIIIEGEDTLISIKESLKNWTIKSILTKEQFEQNCYRLEE